MLIRDCSSDVCSSDLRLPALDDRQIGSDAAFEDIFLAVEHLGFLALGDLGADAGLGIETGDTRPARAAALGKRALGTEFDLDRKGVVSGKSVSVRVDPGGRRIIKKTTRRH